MMIGEIYAEALYLMHLTGREVLAVEPEDGARSLDDARGDDQYADYLARMPGSLNRAISDLELRGAISEAGRVSRLNADTDVPDVPEALCALIPYWIKADLYSQEEPAESAEARNWYEAGVTRWLSDEGFGRDGVDGGGFEAVFTVGGCV